jgi:peptidoglycan-N-acetylglucosamine deacetylase
MDKLWIKTPRIVKRLLKNFVWDIPTNKKMVFLTFDDGPTPEITPFILEQLKLYNAKATFFCIGKNVDAYPKIFEAIVAQGHLIGNHTYNHLKGWKTAKKEYLNNILSCENTIVKHLGKSSHKIFRPPYGRITLSQFKLLKSLGYQIVMWNILSMDYDNKTSPEKCASNVLANVSPGSIVVFHDSKKAFKNLKHALPETLKYLANQEYSCHSIPNPCLG